MLIITFIVSFVLFLGGLFAMGNAFDVVGAEGFVFFGGILLVCISIMIPAHVMQKFD